MMAARQFCETITSTLLIGIIREIQMTDQLIANVAAAKEAFEAASFEATTAEKARADSEAQLIGAKYVESIFSAHAANVDAARTANEKLRMARLAYDAARKEAEQAAN